MLSRISTDRRWPTKTCMRVRAFLDGGIYKGSSVVAMVRGASHSGLTAWAKQAGLSAVVASPLKIIWDAVAVPIHARGDVVHSMAIQGLLKRHSRPFKRYSRATQAPFKAVQGLFQGYSSTVQGHARATQAPFKAIQELSKGDSSAVQGHSRANQAPFKAIQGLFMG